MSVMTPGQVRQGRPIQPLQVAPQGPTTSAVLAGLGVPGAQEPLPSSAPVASSPGTFARGGQVKTLPGGNLAGTVANLGASTGANIAGKIAGNTAAGAAMGSGINLAAGKLADKVRVKEEMPTFGGEFGDLTDQYGRRFQGTGGGTAAGAIRGAGYGANPGLVAATGGLSVVGGAAIGAAIAAAKRHAASAYSDFRVEDAAEAIQNQYRKELGRDASDEEISTHLQNVGWDAQGKDRWTGEKPLNYILGSIRDSPEATAFDARGAEPAADAGVATSDVEPRGMRDVAAAMTGEAPAAGGGAGVLEGFDAEKLASGHNTPKYVFARAAQGVSNTDPDRSAKILAALKADPSGYFANATLSGDKLQVNNADPVFDGINEFDIQRDEENGGGFHWEPTGQGGGQSADAQLLGLLAGGGGQGTPATPAGDGSSLPGVMEAIQKLLASQGQTNQAGYTDALLRELNATA